MTDSENDDLHGEPDSATEATIEADASDAITSQVEQPAKVMRIGTMIKQLLEEVRAAPLDESGRARLRSILETSVGELEQALAPELRDELARLTVPFGDRTPSEAELRVAQAQLVGWLEGLFQGIQTALMAQQLQARQQLEEMRRRALPSGGRDGGQPVIVGPGGQMIMPPGAHFGQPGEDDEPGGRGTGQYL